MNKYRFETPSDGNYFFGYYDKSPLNKNDSKLLACRANFSDKMPDSSDILQIGYFDWKRSNEFIELTETRAWNWQQGCMLQWFPSDNQNKIIYNDRVNGEFVTVIFDIATMKKKTLPMSYYSLDSNGDFILCIDNERHYWHRNGYSYQGVENKSKKAKIDLDDGIWKIDVNTGKIKQIINISTLLNNFPLDNMRGATHYVEHIMLSPNNQRFLFLHRWLMDSGDIYSRLYSSNIKGNDLFLLNDSGRMSHYCWKNNTEVFGWGGISNPINKLRKYRIFAKYMLKPILPIYHKIISGKNNIANSISGDGYIIFRDKSLVRSKLFSKKLVNDGHPSFNKNKENFFVTDTYPDKNDDYNQKLYYCDLINNSVVKIDTIPHNKKFADAANRCDLHPKISNSGKYVCVDTFELNMRGMRIYEL